MSKFIHPVSYTDSQMVVFKTNKRFMNKLSGSCQFKFSHNDELIEKNTKLQTEKAKEREFVETDKMTLKEIINNYKNIEDEIRIEKLEAKKNKPQKKYTINKKKIRQKLSSYFNLAESKKRISFVTISFPFKTSDKEAKRLLNLWLTKLRALKILDSYLWVAERQKNKTIHFHLITYNYVNFVKWNKLMRDSLQTEYKKNNKKYHGYNPEKYNGVDLAKDEKTKKPINFAKKKRQKALSIYLTKYVTKNNVSFDGLAWYCSKDISRLFTKCIEYLSVTEISEIFEDKYDYYFEHEMFYVFARNKKLKTELLELMISVNQMIHDSF